jgi:hypothetical protein
MTERRRPGVPIVALLLIAAGVTLLLQNLGIVRWELWLEIWRFWPVLVIAIGLGLIFGKRLRWLSTSIFAVLIAGAFTGAALMAEGNSELVVERISEPLGGANRLDMWVGIDLGDLTIDSAYGSRNLEGSFASPCGGAATLLGRYRDVASLNVNRAEGSPVCMWGADWRVYVPRVPEVVVDVEANAAAVYLNLTDINVAELYVDANAASVEIAMPYDAGHVRALIEAVGASIDVRIPEGVEALIVNDSALTSFDVGGRFRSLEPVAAGATIQGRDPGNIYESPGYRTAENRVYIEINARLSSVSIR